MRSVSVFLGIFMFVLSVAFARAAIGDIAWQRIMNLSGGADNVYDLAINSAGVYAFGSEFAGGNQIARIERLSRPNGNLLWERTSNTVPSVTAGAADETGVYAGGFIHIPWESPTRRFQRRIEKKGINGMILWGNSSITSYSIVNDVAVDATGLYVVSSYPTFFGPFLLGDSRWLIEKFAPNGAPLWQKVINPTNSQSLGLSDSEEPARVAVNSNNIYVLGNEGPGGSGSWSIKKLSFDGEVLGSFPSPVYNGLEWPGFIADSNGLYIGSAKSIGGIGKAYVGKLDVNNGSVIWEYTSPLPAASSIRSLAIDPTGIYSAGKERIVGGIDSKWRVEKVSFTGNPLWKFYINPDGFDTGANSVVVDGSGVYIAGYDFAPGNGQWHVEKRSISPALTISFNGAGSGSVDVSPPGVTCSIACVQQYVNGSNVTLTPNADFGSTFVGWSGDPDCAGGSLIMDADKTCAANFDLLPPSEEIAVQLQATPSSGNPPLTTILRAEVLNNVGIGDYTYAFDCDGSGPMSPEPSIVTADQNAEVSCTYTVRDTYTALVIVSRSGALDGAAAIPVMVKLPPPKFRERAPQ